MTDISPKTIEIVKATAPLVKKHATEITSAFYPKMLTRHPELFKYFNESNQRTGRQGKAFGDMIIGKASRTDKCIAVKSMIPSAQSKTLADAVVAYALNIDKLDNLSETVMRISHKHCALGVTPADYIIVHDNLMEAIGEVLDGHGFTPEVAAAWSEAVKALGAIFVGVEKGLYEQAAKEQWTGPKEFKITKIVQEAPDVKSFQLQAVDGSKPGPYNPGQYISVYEKPNPQKEYSAPRHYTLTSQPDTDDYYQVSIKNLKAMHGFDRMLNKVTRAMTQGKHGIPDGVMSSYMHRQKEGNVIKLGPVFGPNLLAVGKETRPACFVSVGIGITPTRAMLPAAIKTRPSVAVFHGDASAKNVAFRQELVDLFMSVKNAKKMKTLSFSYSHEDAGDKTLPFYSSGRLTGAKICEGLKDVDDDYKQGVDYYICAGAATTSIVKQLWAQGVEKKNIHTEFFGPFASVDDDEE